MNAVKKVELLAPAGNAEAFYGAIHAGADAVYLGGSRFGARAYAENFSEEELQGKEKELYDLKHELISAQIKLENAEKQGKELQKQLNEDAKKIVRLETELKDK